MDLPKRDPTIKVEVDEEEGVVATLETLTGREMAELMDRNVQDEVRGRSTDSGGLSAEEVRLRISLPQMVDLFTDKCVELEDEDGPVTIEGEPFDPENEEHRAAIGDKISWAIKAGNDLVQYGQMTEADQKN